MKSGAPNASMMHWGRFLGGFQRDDFICAESCKDTMYCIC